MAQWKVNFDDLDLGERIGKGNFGEVYKGTYLGTDVAIKKLFFVDDDFMQKYIEREMDTLTYQLPISLPSPSFRHSSSISFALLP
jgi:serine/threonine protein kinase